MLEKISPSKLVSKLYLSQKLSMAQIAERLGVSPSTVRYWLDKNQIPRRPIKEAIDNLYFTKFHKNPFKLKTNLSHRDDILKTAGIMLYWGEGGKSGNVVKFTNSDPQMIRLFMRFLRDICGIREERIRALIHIYPDHNGDKLKSFWSDITGIPKKYFYKSYTHKGKTGTYKNKSLWGTLAISYGDKRLLATLLEWIGEYKS